MKKIIAYQIFLLMMGLAFFLLYKTQYLPVWLEAHQTPIYCILLAGLGGCTYCLRAIYLNFCVKNRWDPVWSVWYYLRPIVSLLVGFASFIFFKTGLIILDAQVSDDSQLYGFYALSFVAGLNVDKFIAKIEDISASVWGIEKSRASSEYKEF